MQRKISVLQYTDISINHTLYYQKNNYQARAEMHRLTG